MTTTPMMERVTKARIHLLLDHPFWGTLALRLHLQETTRGCETLQTNGTVLEFNPDYIGTLNDEHVMGGVAHEVAHCAFLHPYRGRDLDPMLANIAADYAINPLLKASGLKLPDGHLDEARFHGMAFEQIYAIIHSEKPKEKDEPGGGGTCGHQPGGNGGGGAPGKRPTGGDHFVPADQPGDAPDEQPSPGGTPPPSDTMTELDWQVMAETAASVSRKAGGMSGDIARALAEARAATVDWKTVLRRFVEQVVPSDYSWSTPNRRYVAAGLYLPGAVKENTPRLGIAIDTSGSIDQPLLDMFASEMTGIMLETRPSAIDVVYCDTRIKGEQTFTPDDGPIVLKPVGGGGTRFGPVFDWLGTRDEPPAALIYFTDLESFDKPVEPSIPVLWVTPMTVRREGLFGETVRIPPVERR